MFSILSPGKLSHHRASQLIVETIREGPSRLVTINHPRAIFLLLIGCTAQQSGPCDGVARQAAITLATYFYSAFLLSSFFPPYLSIHQCT